MSLHKTHILTLLLLIPLLTACSTSTVKPERLIYLSPSSSVPLGASVTSAIVSAPASASAKAESKKSTSESSSKYKGSGSSNSGSSKKSTTTSEVSKKDAASSGSAKKETSSGGASPSSSAAPSSSVASSSTSSGGSDTPTENAPSINDIVSLYNGAIQKNAALSGVQFRFANRDSNQKETTGIVKFNNRIQSPVFLLSIDQTGGYVYYNAADKSIYFYQGGCWMPFGQSDSVDMTQYIIILDPALSADNVNACSFTRVDDNRVLDFTLTSGFEKYAAVFQIFSVSGSIRKIQMEYTLSRDGYIIGSRQVFTLSDDSELSMEKSYLDIGAPVDLSRNS